VRANTHTTAANDVIPNQNLRRVALANKPDEKPMNFTASRLHEQPAESIISTEIAFSILVGKDWAP
jgi:hypothetical protein